MTTDDLKSKEHKAFSSIWVSVCQKSSATVGSSLCPIQESKPCPSICYEHGSKSWSHSQHPGQSRNAYIAAIHSGSQLLQSVVA